MQCYSIYMGLKEATIPLPWGLCIQHTATWSLRVRKTAGSDGVQAKDPNNSFSKSSAPLPGVLSRDSAFYMAHAYEDEIARRKLS